MYILTPLGENPLNTSLPEERPGESGMNRIGKIAQVVMDVRIIDVRIIKVVGVLGLGTDFLFHWVETKSAAGLIMDGFYDVQLELGGAWGWAAGLLALAAHILFIVGFLALIGLPLKIEEVKRPWDGLKQVAQLKDSLVLTLIVALVGLSALSVAFKALGMWPYDMTWPFEQ